MNGKISKYAIVLHKWIGLLTGFVVFIVCLTGGMYVFRTEITNLLVGLGIAEQSIDSVFGFIIDGHQYLWLPPTVGQPIVGYCVLLFFITLITGIIEWLPRRLRLSSLAFRGKAKGRALVRELHVLLGIYLVVPILLLCFTGMVYALGWFAQLVGADGYMDFVAHVHRGQFWGVVGQIIMFVASLIGASLPITGYLLWWRKRGRNKY